MSIAVANDLKMDNEMTHIEKTDSATTERLNRAIAANNAGEHDMTFGQVAKRHPKIIFWSFFWSLCAVGCKWRRFAEQCRS